MNIFIGLSRSDEFEIRKDFRDESRKFKMVVFYAGFQDVRLSGIGNYPKYLLDTWTNKLDMNESIRLSIQSFMHRQINTNSVYTAVERFGVDIHTLWRNIQSVNERMEDPLDHIGEDIAIYVIGEGRFKELFIDELKETLMYWQIGEDKIPVIDFLNLEGFNDLDSMDNFYQRMYNIEGIYPDKTEILTYAVGRLKES